jgi:hypothetical protein
LTDAGNVLLLPIDFLVEPIDFLAHHGPVNLLAQLFGAPVTLSTNLGCQYGPSGLTGSRPSQDY